MHIVISLQALHHKATMTSLIIPDLCNILHVSLSNILDIRRN